MALGACYEAGERFADAQGQYQRALALLRQAAAKQGSCATHWRLRAEKRVEGRLAVLLEKMALHTLRLCHAPSMVRHTLLI